MTMPVVHGYPDFARQVAEADVLLKHETNTATAGEVVRGPYFVGGETHLGFFFTVGLVFYRMAFEFYADKDLTLPLTNHVVEVTPFTSASFSVPVLSPWLQIRLTPGAGTDPFSFRLWTAAGQSMHMEFGGSSNVLISNAAVAVGAGAFVDVDAVRVWPGECTWMASSALATWSCELLAVGSLGGLTRLDFINQTRNLERRTLFLPAMILKARLGNQTGAPGNIGIHVVARPLGPGR